MSCFPVMFTMEAWDESVDVLDPDGLAEDCTVKLVMDGTVGALPHFFKLELHDTGLVSCNGGALNATNVVGAASTFQSLIPLPMAKPFSL